jgi:hypothetical protein
VEVFTPTCTNFTLQKVDWSYCNPITLRKCGNGQDTLINKTRFVINNENAIVKYSITSGYCVVINDPSSTVYKGSFTAINLPDCFKKDGIKIKISGVVKETLTDLACGSPMEITKLEEIP